MTGFEKWNLRDRVYGNLVTFAVSFLNSGVVGIFVRNEVGCFDVTTIRILALSVEHFFVEFDVVVIDGIIEGDGDHLWYVFRR